MRNAIVRVIPHPMLMDRLHFPIEERRRPPVPNPLPNPLSYLSLSLASLEHILPKRSALGSGRRPVHYKEHRPLQHDRVPTGIQPAAPFSGSRSQAGRAEGRSLGFLRPQ